VARGWRRVPFELSEEQELIRRTARAFADKALQPATEAMDREARFPAEVQRGLAELGFWGLLAPAEVGGAGVDLTSFAVALEELARRSGSAAAILLAHNLAARAVPDAALATGEALATWQLARGPLAGSWSGGEALEGTARLFPLAGRARVAVLEHPAGGLAVLAADDAGQAWVREGTMGLRGAELGQLVLRGARPRRVAGQGSAAEQVGLAAIAVGLGQAAVEEGVRFARDRVQFGQSIAAFEGVRARLADMATGIDAGRALLLQASALADRGEGAERLAAEAKVAATEAASQSTRWCVKLHGGAGFLKDFAAERLHRDARMLPLLGSDSAALRDAAGRALVGR
jgi:alkylation response protein AidB-like acyl-CoA dehydrogenase